MRVSTLVNRSAPQFVEASGEISKPELLSTFGILIPPHRRALKNVMRRAFPF